MSLLKNIDKVSHLKFASLMMMKTKWLMFKKQVNVSVDRKEKYKEHTTKNIDICNCYCYVCIMCTLFRNWILNWKMKSILLKLKITSGSLKTNKYSLKFSYQTGTNASNNAVYCTILYTLKTDYIKLNFQKIYSK